MRLIDADEAVNIINAYDDRWLTLDEVIRVTDGIAKEIEAMPTVDAVEVVRCGWCSWFRKGYCVHPVQDMIPVMAGHFCGYGERGDGD